MAVAGSLPSVAGAQECLYVLDQLNNAVTMVRRETEAIIGNAQIPTDDCPTPPCNPAMPTALEFAASNGRVYVTRQDVNLAYVVDPVAKTVVDNITIDSGSRPLAASAAAALTPNGATLFVANLAADSVSVISTSSNELVDTITVGDQPRAVAVTPDGNTALVANNRDDDLSVIRTSDGAVTDTIDVGDQPAGIAITPNGARAYVANGNAASVSVVDITAGSATGTIPVGASPRGVAVTPDGDTVLVTNVLDATVSFIDVAGGSVSGGPLQVGAGPVAVAISNDGTTAYVANLMGNTISVIDIDSRDVDTIEGVSAPFDLAFGPCPPDPTPVPGECVGDCNGGGTISIAELIIGVNIALGFQQVSACPAFDRSGDSIVSIAELISAVNNSLNGCPD